MATDCYLSTSLQMEPRVIRRFTEGTRPALWAEQLAVAPLENSRTDLVLIAVAAGQKQYQTCYRRLSNGTTTEVAVEADASTQPVRVAFTQQVEAVFAIGQTESFEDGMETRFSRSLLSLIEHGGNQAVDVVTSIILAGRAEPTVSAEALRWLGRMDDEVSRPSRLRLLEYALFSPSPTIRDGAMLGIASMDDPAAIPALKQAIEREKYPQVRADMEQVLTDLESR